MPNETTTPETTTPAPASTTPAPAPTETPAPAASTTTPASTETPAAPAATAETTAGTPTPGATVPPTVPPSVPTPAGEPFDAAKLTLPANSPLVAADIQGIAEEARTLGLSMSQARTLVTQRDAELRDALAANARALGELKTDSELGGANYETTLLDVGRGLDFALQNAPQGEADYVKRRFAELGLANDKAFVRMFARVGRARREGGPVPSSTAPVARPKSHAEILFGGEAAKAAS